MPVSTTVKKWPELQAKTSTDKVKVWNIHVTHCALGYQIVVSHGQKGGKQITEHSDPVKGKNIGRANETTPRDQALAEAEAQWVKKKERKGYAEKLEDANTSLDMGADGVFFLPMLAHDAKKKPKYVTFPGYLQPKFDGWRMLARKREDGTIEAWSRGLKPFSQKILPEIFADLRKLLSVGDVVDGELYCHDFDRDEIAAAAKKRNDNTPSLVYMLYDMPVWERFHTSKSMPYKFGNRHTRLFARFLDQDEQPVKYAHVRLAQTEVMHNSAVVGTFEEGFVEEGYEGAMYRSVKGLYKSGARSSDLLKIKRFKDAEFTIVSAEEGSGKDAGTVVWTCATSSGSTFNVRPKGSHQKRAAWWKNRQQHIGKMLTVKYQNLSAGGIPQHPVGKGFRDPADI